MVDMKMAALLRAVHEDVCRELPATRNDARLHVAVRMLEAAKGGEISVVGLRQIAHGALIEITGWGRNGGLAAPSGNISVDETGIRTRHAPAGQRRHSRIS